MKIEVVCYANYCRSPIVSKIFNEFCNADVSSSSSGLSPYKKNSMDPRSKHFLENIGISNLDHYPRAFSDEIGIRSDLIVVCDMSVYFELKKKYKSFSKKIHLISKYSKKNLALIDPYECSSQEQYDLILSRYLEFSKEWIKALQDKNL